MQKLLIATSNAGKVAQYRKGLEDLGLELVSLKDLGFSPVEETGSTFEENALLKARAYFNQSGLPCIADDGGLEIDFLGGKPGITSRRWKTGDEQVTDQELVEFTIEQMRGVPVEKRTARFSMAMTFVDADGKEHVAHASTEGYVPLQASNTILPHLPFDSVLFIPQFGKTRSELTQEQYESISQRFLALKKLKPIIAEALCGN
ncbi:MAG TPA: non-canonical purine NTP pyrophosphatase [Candidatus Paceibacterota bacterium]|nr:non-canonical purine NTP pyrophosphatase [Candidatus Paceibacterota bacterium]